MDAHEAVRGNALRLPLQLERLDLLDVDVVAYEAVGEVSEQDLLGAGSLLEPCRDVHGVASHEPLARGGIPGDDLARVHACPNREANAPVPLQLVVQNRLGPLHVRGCPHGAERVVLVHRRKPEHGHDRVTDELLDDTAVPLELGAHGVEVAGHHLSQRLRVELLAHGRGSLEIREHDRSRPSAPRALPAAVRGATSALPHAKQNFATSGFSVPHWEQNGTGRVSHQRACLSNVYRSATRSPRKGEVRFVSPDE